MSAIILQLPDLNLIAAQMRLARYSYLVESDLEVSFTDWLLAQVVEGRLTIEMAEAICRYRGQAA